MENARSKENTRYDNKLISIAINEIFKVNLIKLII